MRMLRRFGSLGVVMIIALASLLVGAAPALAVGTTHYENVGNPGWCLDGNDIGDAAYLHRCGHGQVDYQRWFYTSDAIGLQLIHHATDQCLTALPPNEVTLRFCGGGTDIWDALGTGTTGQVMLKNVHYGKCLAPNATWIPGRSTYPLFLLPCDVTNTLVKWRYFN